jgi:hypothetical protein
MRRLRFLLAALLATLAVASLPAQFTRTTAPQPLAYHDLVYLGDETLQKELKLTAEQAKQVSQSRERLLRSLTRQATTMRG